MLSLVLVIGCSKMMIRWFDVLNSSPHLTWPCLLGPVVDAFEVPIDGKDALSAAERRRVKVKNPYNYCT